MTKTATTRYDVAEHLRIPEEMVAYFEVCFEEADGDAAFLAKQSEISLTPKACRKWFSIRNSVNLYKT